MPASSSGAGDSGAPIATPDGRYVVFASTANNLVPGMNSMASSGLAPRYLNVFLRDRTWGSTVLVSANLAGTGGGNGDSWPTGISSNGQYILFESTASNLVLGDTNQAADVFLRDVFKGTTVLVSVALAGGSGNGPSRSSMMTPDGRWVTFVSAANNVAAGDTNQIADVFVRDLASNTTTLVSTGATLSSWSPGVSSSELPFITPDGRYVAFSSTATNLVSNATTQREIYVRDLVGQTTTLASTNSRAIFGSLFGSTDVASFNHVLSADGQFVAYQVGPTAAYPATGAGVIVRQNLQTGTADIGSTNAAQPVGYENCRSLDMTPDGRYIAYIGNVGSPGGSTAVYLWDAQSNATSLVSADIFGATPSGDCQSPVLTADGQSVGFVSSASNLTTNVDVGGYHAYVRNVAAGTTELVDADTNDAAAGVAPTVVPALSSDGEYAVVASMSEGLVTNDSNHGSDVFIRARAAGDTELVPFEMLVYPLGLEKGQVSFLTQA
jgi:Tol biopolymer transport system component